MGQRFVVHRARAKAGSPAGEFISVGPESDLFSVASLAANLLTGHDPFELGPEEQQLVSAFMAYDDLESFSKVPLRPSGQGL